MRPVREGDRGPAVEDIQRRLLVLDHDIGPTGVDGVFMGATLAAVRDFQRENGIAEDGVVGQQTWSAMVDATFKLGDRLLYLRSPYFHGRDVMRLQTALNTLGFACGDADAIFGAFTERAVREFQRNVGAPADGIVGGDTVAAIENLRHIWEGKDPTVPAPLSVAPARAAETLAREEIRLEATDDVGRDVAGRIANLAGATTESALLEVVDGPSGEESPGLTVILGAWPGGDVWGPTAGVPVVVVPPEGAEGVAARVVTAMEAGPFRTDRVVVDLSGVGPDEHGLQSVAVGLLDGFCAALA